ncbi:MAG TPA: cytochrome c3 family protein [Candidatus Deferrimicrobium sp.]|nr:cytochrome c3 family protein [Candidatus Deferrimicrobium sp.]
MRRYALAGKLLVGIVWVLFCGAAHGSGSILTTKHNLSTSGEGEIKSTTESEVCTFCHSSHNTSGEGPLWSHETTSPARFKTYDRTTMNSRAEQPNGATKLCLSCHDGTIAVGAIRGLNRPVPMRSVGSQGEIPVSRPSHIGTDLSGTHPVSVKYQEATALADDHLRWPPFDPERKVGVDAAGYVQCTSCHDPHDDSRSAKYPFWKKATFDEVCTVCHKY